MNKIIPNITYKSVLTGYKSIGERNKAFNALDEQSQRLEIAWDALQLVVSGRVSASFNTYWSDSLRYIAANTPKQLQELLNDCLPECHVCQRGLMMVSQIRLGNSVDPYDSNRTQGDIYNIKGFSIYDFRAMEKEFEYIAFDHPYEANSSQKLANICCNVLVNGNFRIEDKTDYLLHV